LGSGRVPEAFGILENVRDSSKESRFPMDSIFLSLSFFFKFDYRLETRFNKFFRIFDFSCLFENSNRVVEIFWNINSFRNLDSLSRISTSLGNPGHFRESRFCRESRIFLKISKFSRSDSTRCLPDSFRLSGRILSVFDIFRVSYTSNKHTSIIALLIDIRHKNFIFIMYTYIIIYTINYVNYVNNIIIYIN